VTVAIVAVSGNRLVAASDERLSFGDVHPASDGTRKNFRLGGILNWHFTFSADDVAMVPPVIRGILERLEGNRTPDAKAMMRAAEESYSEVLQKDFFVRRLAQLGFETLADFRQNGFHQLGPQAYADYLQELARHRLGLELIIYGHHQPGQPFVFRVEDPGRAIEDIVMGYSVTGSGSYMALASLRQKPIPGDLSSTIYRVLEAKFASETASYVGQTTFLVIVNSDGTPGAMPADDIQSIKEIWKKTLKEPVSAEAKSIIQRSTGVF
jgi:hypothetical protein